MASFDIRDQYGGKIGELRERETVDVGGLILLALMLTLGVFWLAWKLIVLCVRYPKLGLVVLVAGLAGAVVYGTQSANVVPNVAANRSQSAVVRREASRGLYELLPGAAELPAGMAVVAEGERTLAEVAQAYSNPDETARLFGEWGWQANAYRQFAAQDSAGAGPDGIDHVRVGIHRFGSAAEAAAAAEYVAADTLLGTGGSSGPGPSLGDGATTLSGSNENGRWVIQVVRGGADVFSIGASSPTGDPGEAAVALARAVIGQ